jgi:alpha-1,3-rhamnosyl/mannosyltransferase
VRIAIDARAIGPHFPGIGRATLGLLRGLRELDHAERILVLVEPGHRELVAETGLAADERFTLAPVLGGPFSASQQWRLPMAARATRLDLWHAPYYFRPFWGLPPTVVSVFDTIGPGFEARSMLLERRTRLVWRIAMRLSLRGACRVITASAWAKRELQAVFHVPTHRIAVVPLAVDDRFQPQPKERIAAIRAKYSLPEQYVLYVGSNKPHKNQVALVEAWAHVAGVASPDSQDDPSLVIAGREDPRYRAPRQRVGALGLERSVRFVPDIPDADLPALLSGAQCFVFPSQQEGFGLPPLEAMACGTPVIASNRTSLPEVVGDAGLLVEPEPAALAVAILRLLGDQDLRRDLAARGRARAAIFTWRHTASETLRIYHEVVR